MASRSPTYLLLAALLAAGCSDPDGVRVSDEPPPRPAGPTVSPDQKKFRTLAAMVPSDSPGEPGWWFFKFSGPADVVARYEADFDKLFASVRSTAGGDDPVSWDLPTGWTRAPGDKMGMRYATLKAPNGDAEVAVSRAGGHVLSNVQRWWGQLWGKDKEREVTAAHLAALTSTREVKGRVVVRVDLVGPNDPNAARPAMMNPHGNPHGGQ